MRVRLFQVLTEQSDSLKGFSRKQFDRVSQSARMRSCQRLANGSDARTGNPRAVVHP
jgi:hypothetical protein